MDEMRGVKRKQSEMENTERETIEDFDISFLHPKKAINESFADLILTNGTISVKVHKAVIQRFSSTIKEILAGDCTTKEIKMSDISNDGLNWLIDYIYTPSSEQSSLPVCDLFSILVLIKKYDFKAIHQYSNGDLPYNYNPIDFPHDLNKAKDLGLEDICHSINQELEYWIDKLNDTQIKSVHVSAIEKLIHGLSFWDSHEAQVFAGIVKWINMQTDSSEKERVMKLLQSKNLKAGPSDFHRIIEALCK